MTALLSVTLVMLAADPIATEGPAQTQSLNATLPSVSSIDHSKSTVRDEGPPEAIRAVLGRITTQLSTAKVGDWVKYELDGGPNHRFYMRMAVTGAEKDEKGRDAVWLEMEFANHVSMNAPLVQMKMLCALGNAQGLTANDSVTRLFVALGLDKPAEASKEVLADVLKPDPAFDASMAQMKNLPADAPKIDVIRGKPASLMTYAGTVTAVSIEARYKSVLIQKLWLSEDVPLLKIAKLEIPKAGQRVEVRDFGTKARPLMVMPGRDEPKLQLGNSDELWGKFAPEEDQEAKHGP